MIRSVVLMLMVSIASLVSSQSILGKWKTIDDKTGEAKSIVEIYEDSGKVYGKIVDILNPSKKNALCAKCEGDEFNKPVLGLVLIKNMEKDGKYYRKGTIFDPQEGKKYKCRIALTEDPDVLQVRGYIAFFYATQYWKRVK